MDRGQSIHRAATKRLLAEIRLRDEIRAAHDEGMSLRDIARFAVMSHEKVRQIVNKTPRPPR